MIDSLKKEVIAFVLEYFGFNKLKGKLISLTYDSEIYPVRDFFIIFDENYNDLYIGYNFGEAYWDPYRAPKDDGALNIYYIQNLDNDNYIFFDINGIRIAPHLEFIKVDNMDRGIYAKCVDGYWYRITTSGAIPDFEEQS